MQSKNIRSKFIVLFICAFPIVAFSVQPLSTERMVAQCRTAPTDVGGWKTCESGWNWLEAEKGYYIDLDSLKPITTRMTGGGSCDFRARRYTEVSPGNRQPRKMAIQATASSPAGIIGGVASTLCEYTINVVAYE